MRKILIKEICKEKPNSSAFGALNTVLGSDTSSQVKNQVIGLYKEQTKLQNAFDKRDITPSQFDEKLSDIGRKINQIEKKNGVFYKDLFVKSLR